MNYNEKCKLDTWSKLTQTKTIYGEQAQDTERSRLGDTGLEPVASCV